MPYSCVGCGFNWARIGEILALRWRRIDTLPNTMEVAETYSSGEFGPPKHAAAVERSRSARRLEKFSGGFDPRNCEPERIGVRNSQRGPHLTPKTCTTGNWHRGMRRDRVTQEFPGTPSATPTRRCCMTPGESLKTAQSLLGHSDLESTLGVYTHAIPDSQRRAVERVAGVLDSVGLKTPYRTRFRGDG